MAAVAQLQGGDVALALVGDEGGVAIALGIEDAELGAGVRPLAAADQPRSLGPSGEVDAIAQLRDLGTLTLFALGVDRLLPSRIGKGEDRLPHPFIDAAADREAHGGVAAVGGEGVGGAADVGPREDLAVEV